jgi:AcrR family transcriptional regulator
VGPSRAPSVAAPNAPAAVRERLVAAAFSRFAEGDFETTTVDDIAMQAGVSRRTFFRHFATKEDVVFPDHEAIRSVVAADLARRRAEPPLAVVCAAVSLVLDDYIAHRDVSLARFALTRRVTALRDREVTNVHRYQRLFARYLQDRAADPDPIVTEIMAASVVAGHNSVLREWLVTGGTDNPRARLASVLNGVQTLFDDRAKPSGGSRTGIVAFAIGTPLSEITTAVRSLTEGTGRAENSP